MPKFKSTSDLMAYIRKAVDVSLSTDVFKAVNDAEVEAINDVVYSGKFSGAYARRGSSGGLGDPSNIVIVGGVATNGILAVKNITQPNPFLNGISASGGMATVNKDLPSVVESGYGYDYWKSSHPRRFTQITIQNLIASGACTSALKQGLIKQGIAVR